MEVKLKEFQAEIDSANVVFQRSLNIMFLKYLIVLPFDSFKSNVCLLRNYSLDPAEVLKL